MGKNAQRAKDLLEDVKMYNPALIKQLKKERTEPLEYLVKFLDMVDERERMTLTALEARIPKNLDPMEYQQELNWKKQQARELANEEVNSLLR